jgi:hypothetical protein
MVDSASSIDFAASRGMTSEDTQLPSQPAGVSILPWLDPNWSPGHMDELAVKPAGNTHAGALHVQTSQMPGEKRSS